MFLDLIRLYNRNRNSNRTPLEDFNTECFANVLKLFPKIFDEFLYNFLKLPFDNYIISTQVKGECYKTGLCIIDLVFIGKENVCFIENKVESTEGWEQLNRYSEILELYHPGKKKFLFYCTKNTDLKNQNGEYNKYGFRQFKWFEIAKLLKKYKKDNSIIQEYINFLSHYKMEQDNTFRSQNLVTMENMVKTIEIIEFHINNSKVEFDKLFKSAKYNYNFNWGQLREHERFCHYSAGILKSNNNAFSEILYSIELSTLRLNTQIYITAIHDSFKEFKNIEYCRETFKFHEAEHGCSIYIDENLSKYLNNEDSDIEIKEWFLNSFNSFYKLMKNNPQLEWSII